MGTFYFSLSIHLIKMRDSLGGRFLQDLLAQPAFLMFETSMWLNNIDYESGVFVWTGPIAHSYISGLVLGALSTCVPNWQAFGEWSHESSHFSRLMIACHSLRPLLS